VSIRRSWSVSAGLVGVGGRVGEEKLKLLHRAVNADAGRTRGDSEPASDVAIREVVIAAKDQGGASFFREGSHGRPKPRHSIVRERRRGDGLAHGQLLALRLFPSSRGGEVDARIPHHAHEPRLEPAPAVEAGPVSKDPQEGVLHRIGGIVSVAQKPRSEGEGHIVVRVEEPSDRDRITTAQRFCGVQGW
jgi:hypothetical protein